jgi:uncharacterized Tic20 family protein
MNNDQIPAKIRYIAAALHLIFIVSKLPILFVSSLKFELILLNTILTFVNPIIAWVFWLKTSKIHHFIDLAGRDVINYSLNNLMLLLWLVLPLFIAGVGLLQSAFLPISYYTNNVFFVVCIAILCILSCLEIFYLIHAIVGSMFAIKGHRFQSRLVHYFIRSE